MSPETFGPYEIESLLGRGGMGEVYRARDTRRERLVALKLLPQQLSHDKEYLNRFRREQLVAARLREPHVIPIHDFGEIDGQLFIDMRLVDGEDIAAMLAGNGALEPGRAVHLISQIAEALNAAHVDGLVHRDVKPSNVLVTPSDFVYVVDFGIARSIGMTRTSLTITGATVGTLDYMAPERFTNLPIDARADVYSLACLLHECLTASRPFPGEDLPSLMYAHLYSTAPPASSISSTVPPRLDEVITKGMAKRPEDRFGSTLELAAAAREALQAADRVPRAPVTVRAPAPLVPEEPRTSQLPVGHRDSAAGSPLPIVGLGLAAADGSHRSVNRLPAPDAVVPADRPATLSDGGGPPAHAGSPAGPPPGGAGAPQVADPAPHRGRRWAVPAVVAAVLVAVLALSLWLPGSGGDARSGSGGEASASSAPSGGPPPGPLPTQPTPAIAPEPSIPIPLVGGTVTVGRTPGYIQVAPNGRYAYIANRDEGVVTVLDTTTTQVTATIRIEAGPPQFITFSPDGRTAYVTVYNSDYTVNAVAFLDTASNKVTRTVPVGRRPFAPATTPDGHLLYVPSHDEGRLDIIDTSTGTIVKQVTTPPNPHWVVFGGGRYYTADHESGVVTAFDAATDTLVATIPTGKAPHSLALSPDGSRLSVVNYESNTLSVIDTSTDTVVANVEVGRRPQDVTYAPDGRYLYTANVDEDTVTVVDTATNLITARIPTGDGPSSISVLPNGRQAFVTNLNEGTVRILDITAV